ncbi:hypothetical protein, partial [Klebsiella pneumoniae]|uniref:hypothetical protein n=1 Tax=Klebsiella pneumoniae TaxID=573 RepID=UPI001952DA2E
IHSSRHAADDRFYGLAAQRWLETYCSPDGTQVNAGVLCPREIHLTWQYQLAQHPFLSVPANNYF